jgi:hypothetical protein
VRGQFQIYLFIVIGDEPGQKRVERFFLRRQFPAKPVKQLQHLTEMLQFAIVPIAFGSAFASKLPYILRG